MHLLAKEKVTVNVVTWKDDPEAFDDMLCQLEYDLEQSMNIIYRQQVVVIVTLH